MQKLKALAAFAACFAVTSTTAPAATVQLDGSAFNGTDYVFTYGGTLAPTEGVWEGSKLVILDFAGYVEGSIFSPYADLAAVAELTTSGIVLGPDIVDDPSLYNLVFTYTGGAFQTTPAPDDAPYAPIDFTGLIAHSTFGGGGLGSFGTVTVKNEGDAEGTLVFSLGSVGVPAVPEPATWGLMLIGFAAVGAAARRRSQTRVSFV